MEKKVWKRPCVIGQLFEPNEYVAACYRLACVVGAGGSHENHWKYKEFGKDISHALPGTSGTCADSSANRVVTDNGLLDGPQVGEYNKEQGWISGSIDYWIDTDSSGSVNAGDIIYWHTVSAANDRLWNHVGTLEEADRSHPNHS